MRLALVCVLLLLPSPSSATVWYVDASVVAGALDGTSWSDAFVDLQSALAVADSLDEIWVAAGVYRPTAGNDRAVTFAIGAGVTLYGGFAGGETALEDRDWTVNATVLSGDVGVRGLATDNSYNVVEPGPASGLDGFTVRDGRADGPASEWRRGAGVYVTHDDVSLRHCLVTQNRTGSGGYGGGLYTAGNGTTVEDCEFFANAAEGSFSAGGGASAFPNVIDCVFRRVVFRENTSGSEGGGLNFGERAEECTFIGNQSVRTGGGSHWVDVVERCTYEGNVSLGGGGAAYGYLITDSTFTGNTADTGGGIYAVAEARRCLVYGNTAEDGGGVYLSIGQIHDSLIYGNTATHSGGGMYACVGCANGTATNLTIARNTAVFGGGIAGSLNLHNSIVWANDAPNAPGVYPPSYPSASFSYSVLQGSGGSGDGWSLIGSDLGGNLDADPAFVDPLVNDFALGAGSIAIDAGDDARVVGGADVFGHDRIQGVHVDIGAIESAIVVSAPAVRSRWLRGSPNPFNPSLRLDFALPTPDRVELSVHDAAGRRVRTLWSGWADGPVRLRWDGRDDRGIGVASGVYVIRLDASGGTERLKVTLTK